MTFKLANPPMIEQHAENLIHLFVRDTDGAPISDARVKVWAGPAPTGQPAYWNDDQPFRATAASGMLEFITVAGPMPEDRDYWMQVIDNSGAPQSDPIQFHFPRGSTIWITATLAQEDAPTAPSASPVTVTYIVQSGDTLYAIARKLGVTVDALVKANNIANPNLIKPGQVLTIPK